MTTSSANTSTNDVARSTIILLLMAETAFFGTLLMAYLYMRVGSAEVTFRPIASVDRILAVVNTLILLVSVTTARTAEIDIRQGRVDRLKSHLLYTLVLGTVFVAGQIFEFTHSGMTVNDAFFGGIFFALIAFHALHLLAGMTVLVINYRRALRGDFTAERFTAVQMGAWFWYYVAVVWCLVFIALFLV